MHPILEKLNEYLSNATPEQLAADWEELKKYNSMEYGPYIEDVLDNALKSRKTRGCIKQQTEDELCERYYDTIKSLFKDYSSDFEVSMQSGNNFTALVPVQKKLTNPSKEIIYKYIMVKYHDNCFTFTFVVDNTGSYIYGYDVDNKLSFSCDIVPSDSEETTNVIIRFIEKYFIN